MRTIPLALAAVLAAAACTPSETSPCPGTPVGSFLFDGTLLRDVPAGDPRVAALDPQVRDLPDCTPDPDPAAPIKYPQDLPSFAAKLAVNPDTDAAALCRTNGNVLSGTRSGATYTVEASADSAILCGSACVATLHVIVKGDVALDGAGEPTGFGGILVEVLTAARGACDACLPLAPAANPPVRACAARYALSGVPG